MTTDQPDEAEEVVSYYRIEMRLNADLLPLGLDDFIDEYEGQVHSYEEPSDGVRAGEFRATVVRTEDAREAGIAPVDLWEHTPELHDLYALLFDPKTQRLKPSIEGRFDAFSCDVLYLDRISILPAYRGKDLGLAVGSRLIDLLGRGCSIAACLPWPMQFGSLPETEPEKAEELALDALETDRELAKRRIRRHWGKLGFKRLGGKSHYYAMSMSWVRPEILEIAGRLL